MKFNEKWLKEYELARQAAAASAIKAHHQRAANPQPKQTVLNAPLGAEETKGRDTRSRVKISSYRVRLLDPDNMCVKYHVDGLRYAGIIRDDTTNDIELFVRQFKVKTRQEERTEIEIE